MPSGAGCGARRCPPVLLLSLPLPGSAVKKCTKEQGRERGAPAGPTRGRGASSPSENGGSAKGTMASLGRCLKKKVGGGGSSGGCKPKVSEQRGDKRHVSREHKLVKRSEVNPSLVSHGGERWRGHNRRQLAGAGSRSWPALGGCVTNVSLQQTQHPGPSSPSPPAPLGLVVSHQLVLEVMLVQVTALVQSMAALLGGAQGWLCPQDLPRD